MGSGRDAGEGWRFQVGTGEGNLSRDREGWEIQARRRASVLSAQPMAGCEGAWRQELHRQADEGTRGFKSSSHSGSHRQPLRCIGPVGASPDANRDVIGNQLRREAADDGVEEQGRVRLPARGKKGEGGWGGEGEGGKRQGGAGLSQFPPSLLLPSATLCYPSPLPSPSQPTHVQNVVS